MPDPVQHIPAGETRGAFWRAFLEPASNHYFVGGVAELVAALALWRVGGKGTLHERSPEIGEVGAGVALWLNGLRAMERLGMGAAVRSPRGRRAMAGSGSRMDLHSSAVHTRGAGTLPGIGLMMFCGGLDAEARSEPGALGRPEREVREGLDHRA
jgi:hypothetical protein